MKHTININTPTGELIARQDFILHLSSAVMLMMQCSAMDLFSYCTTVKCWSAPERHSLRSGIVFFKKTASNVQRVVWNFKRWGMRYFPIVLNGMSQSRFYTTPLPLPLQYPINWPGLPRFLSRLPHHSVQLPCPWKFKLSSKQIPEKQEVVEGERNTSRD